MFWFRPRFIRRRLAGGDPGDELRTLARNGAGIFSIGIGNGPGQTFSNQRRKDLSCLASKTKRRWSPARRPASARRLLKFLPRPGRRSGLPTAMKRTDAPRPDASAANLLRWMLRVKPPVP